jgi:glycosyltransferase involved in cell wall biosynthesis
MTMSYSVIIPGYNAADTIAETIESALRQTVSPARILVIDDGSTDATRMVAETFGGCVSVQSQANRGPGAAMSLGMRQCDSPLIASIDADDIWLPEKIQRQLDYLHRHPDCHGVFARMRHFGETVVSDVIQDGWGRSTMLIRRMVYDCLGDIVDPPGRRGEMIDWIAQARETGMELTMLPEVLALRRVSPSSLSAGRDSQRDRSYAQVAIAALRRKRARLRGVSGT